MSSQPSVTPPCVGQHQLFDSLHPDDAELALRVCKACPLQDNWCLDRLNEARAAATPQGGAAYHGPQGTWAGQHIIPPQPAKEAQCGTIHGARKHRRNSEPVCDDCRQGERETRRRQLRTQKGDAA